MVDAVSGTEGYAEQADALVPLYEGIGFAKFHAPIMHLVPTLPTEILDIGAGTGRDAAGFAAMGHRVLAVEPTAELRAHAMALHPSPAIEWLDDALPLLPGVTARGRRYGLVLLTAVWFHLDEAQRRLAMPVVAGLVAPGGSLCMTLRHGAVPPGRRMFEVSAAETIALADAQGLTAVLTMQGLPDNFGRGIIWTRLAFTRPG